MSNKRTGRPRVINADSMLTIRIDQDTRNALTVLASDWQVVPSVAVRRAIRECAGWKQKA